MAWQCSSRVSNLQSKVHEFNCSVRTLNKLFKPMCFCGNGVKMGKITARYGVGVGT